MPFALEHIFKARKHTWPGSVAVSISACHAEGREFKSRPGRQNSLPGYPKYSITG